MIHCCNEVQDTPFCPQCGKTLTQDPILGLRQHVRNTLRVQQKRVTRWKRTLEERLKCTEPPPQFYQNRPRRWYEEQLVMAESGVEKWSSWFNALEKLIKEA